MNPDTSNLDIVHTKDGRVQIPEGHEAIRIRVDGKHYDLALPKDSLGAILEKLGEELGAKLVDTEGLDLTAFYNEELNRKKEVVSIGPPSIAELIAKVGDLGEKTPVPHLFKHEYIDRPMLDMGPRPFPSRSPSEARLALRGQNHEKEFLKRRAKNKAAKKARRKNRK